MPASGNAGLNALRVMVVDDDKVMRGILRRMLNQGGVHDVVAASGGDEALALIAGADRVPDVILCDLYMKGLDGLEFCKKVRGGAAAWRQVPIIILTAEHNELVHQVARQIGASRVLTKPISTADLLRAIGGTVGFELDPPSVDSVWRSGGHAA